MKNLPRDKCPICHTSEARPCVGWHCDICGAPVDVGVAFCEACKKKIPHNPEPL